MVGTKQAIKKKNVALVFGVTSDYVFALANTLIGLMRHNKKFWDDIIVYHDGVSEEDMDNINSIVDVKFIDLSEAGHFKKITESGIKTIEKYSIATFYRYECLRLLKKYHRVIWNDVDILIRGDISGLLSYGSENGVAFSMAESGFIMGSSVRKIMDEYKMFVPLWNVGIMVLTDKLKNFEEVCDWCIEATDKYKDELLWPDLAVLNLALQRFDITPENIEADKYVCLPTSKFVDKAAIIHAYGDKKHKADNCH